MFQSQAFIRTRKEAPKDEVSVNARLLARGGYVEKLTSGVYSFLPLGVRVLRNIERVIREEMNAVGGREILLPALHPKELWEETGRWNTVDDLYKIKDRQDREFALGATHEEVVTDIIRRQPISYKDLPFSLFQIQTKFRDEFRAKSGLVRGREFLMKDMYSFHASEEDRKEYYERVKKAYVKVFKRCGLSVIVAEASGGSFSKEISHEFQVATLGGEDIVVVCEKCGWAKNREIADKKQGEKCSACGAQLAEVKSIEVGNIFTLGTKFSSALGATFTDTGGSQKSFVMGCYGIGLGRLMGTVAEVCNDERGVVWPEELAPYKIHIIPLTSKDKKVQERIVSEAEALYRRLQKIQEVLYDDRELSPGEKFADADLIGAPVRVVVSEKTVGTGKAELKERDAKTPKLVKLEDI